MDQVKIPIKATFAQAWSEVKPNLGALAPMVLLYGIALNLGSVIGRQVESASLLISLASFAGCSFLLAGLLKACFQVSEGEKPSFSEFFSGGDLFVPVLIVNFVFTLMVLVGCAALLLPGLFLSAMFGQAMFLVIDRGLSPIEAFKESKRLTEGYKSQVFTFNVVGGLLIFLGVLCLGVGVLVAAPVVLVAQVHVYRFLEERDGGTSVNVRRKQAA